MVQEESLNSNSNATIVCGNTIGRYAFIGAGAVVTKDVPDYTLVLGIPARIAEWMCECGHQIEFQRGVVVCNDCGKQFRRNEEGVRVVEDEWVTQQVANSI